MSSKFLLAVSVFAGAFFAQAQVYVLDHFNCYQIEPSPPLNAAVALQDQFASTTATVLNRIRFCNVTSKVVQGPGGPVVTPITHRDDHLTLYTLSPQPPVNLNVLVSNQFGEQPLTVIQAKFLAVPTQKAPHQQPPVDLDHYKCYSVAGNPVQRPVRLQDQFRIEGALVSVPALLCNPVKKQHSGNVVEVKHPEDHLVCYRKTPRSFSMARDFKNQFESARFGTIASDMLCVPSKKKVLGPADID
jgi:hypothetical protein